MYDSADTLSKQTFNLEIRNFFRGETGFLDKNICKSDLIAWDKFELFPLIQNSD